MALRTAWDSAAEYLPVLGSMFWPKPLRFHLVCVLDNTTGETGEFRVGTFAIAIASGAVTVGVAAGIAVGV